MRRGVFFTGSHGGIFYMTRPGWFYSLEPSGPVELNELEVNDLVSEELLKEQSHEIHALAVQAERLAMVRPPHSEIGPMTERDAKSLVDAVMEAERLRVRRD